MIQIQVTKRVKIVIDLNHNLCSWGRFWLLSMTRNPNVSFVTIKIYIKKK